MIYVIEETATIIFRFANVRGFYAHLRLLICRFVDPASTLSYSLQSEHIV